MRSFELKLSTRRVVVWDGRDGEDAARAYVASHPEAVVIAWRNRERTNCIHSIERPDRLRVIEPTPGMGD